jgi:hypothetical protein
MKRSQVVTLLVVVTLAVGSWGVWGQSTTPGAGGVRVLGKLVGAEKYQLQVEVGVKAEWFDAGAVVVRSEPSGTVLTAMVDGAAPAYLLAQVQGMKPQSLDVGPLFGVTGNLYQGPPPSGDSRVVVEYMVKEGEGWVPFVIADANMGTLDEFQFIATPLSGGGGGGGGFQYCGWCGTTYCGCVTCATPSYTKCCPFCTMVCGSIIC